MATDTILSDFMLEYASSVPVQINNIKVDIEEFKAKDFDFARYSDLLDALDAISTDNDMDYNLKHFAKLYLQTLRGVVMDELKGSILDMAQLCVFENGPSVMEARTYMETDSADGATWTNYLWEDSCSGRGMKRDFMASPPVEQLTKIVKPVPDYRLVPNLYKDNFTAHITLGESEQGEVQIFGLDGRLMAKHKVNGGTNTVDLSGDGLQADVYLYKVSVNGESKTNGKLVVVH